MRQNPYPVLGFRTNSYPVMGVDMQTGRIYIVWVNIGEPGTNVGDPDVYLIFSDDDGQTWSTPKRVNDDQVDNDALQFHCWLSVDPVTGDLFTAFYDNRANIGTSTCEFYIAKSNDGGLSFVNYPVSDNSFPTGPLSGFDGNYNGEYPGIAASNKRVYSLWHTQVPDANSQGWTSSPEVEVTVDQRNSGGTPLSGTSVGRWEGGPDFQDYPIPITEPLTFLVGSMEVLKGHQELVGIPVEKYNRWNDEPDVSNHHKFIIKDQPEELVSWFKPSKNVILKTKLISGGSGHDIIEFKDPWFIDYPDPEYGNNLRNKGMDADFKEQDSPFNPNTNQTGPGSEYKGVFLNQLIQDGVYYSVRVTQAYATNNVIYGFSHWDVEEPGTAEFENANARETGVVFRAANATVKAMYQAVNQIPGYTLTIPANDELTIPAGANIQCAEGFTIEVEGSLVAEGTKEQPINITGSGREPIFSPFNYGTPELPVDKLISITGQNSVVNLKHIKIENTYCPIAITSENNYVEIKNAEISETNIGVLIEDFNDSQIMIDSVYFHENDACISLPKQLPEVVQKTYLFVMHSVFSNNKFGIYIMPVNTIPNGLESTLRFGIVNNTFYNTDPAPNGSAIWIRPAHLGSYYYGQFGGSFVYNIFHTSDVGVWDFYSQFGNYSFFDDYGNMIDDLNRIPSAIFYNTVQDNPMLIEPENGNFHLSLNSPAIDLGQDEFYAYYIDDDINQNDPVYFELETDPDGTHFEYGAYYVPKLQGTISSDMTIGGEIQVLNYLTIADGVTLTIEDNSTIFVNAGKRLNVYGSLLALGTASNKITFTRADPNNTSSTYWQGIYGISADNLILDFCEIHGAINGSYIKYEPASFNNVLFETCNTGIKFYYSENSIVNNSDFNNCGNALSFAHSTASIKNSTMQECDYGIWSIRGYGNIYKNIIGNNNYDGLYLTDMSGLQLTSESEKGIFPVNNIIENNQRYGVYISSNSNPNLGTYFKLPEMTLGGFNEFNCSDGDYDIYSLNESIIKAEVNYWPEGSNNNGIIDINPTADDLGEGKMAKITGLGKITSDDSLENIISIGDSLAVSGNHRDAIRIYKSVIRTEPDKKISIKALIRIVSCLKETNEISDLLSELDDIYNDFQTNKVGTAALDNSVTLYALSGDYSEALSRIIRVIRVYITDPTMIEETAAALYQQAMIYETMALLNPGLGKDALLASKNSNLLKIIEDYPNTDIAKYLILFEGYEDLFVKTDLIPNEFELSPAYPNPFNSTVNFRFGLKEDANVDLVIFDILGRKVWEYKSSAKMEAGYHNVRWHGINVIGNAVASGLYLVKFKANNFTGSQKIILVK